MNITFDTNNLSELDTAILSLLVGREANIAAATPAKAATPATPAKAAAPAPAKKAAAPAAPKEEPAEVPTSEEAGDTGEEDLLGGQPTMADAVAAATQLVSSGGAAKVKAALATVGAKRVSEVAETDIAAFLAALNG